jgi:hypothetical protein
MQLSCHISEIAYRVKAPCAISECVFLLFEIDFQIQKLKKIIERHLKFFHIFHRASFETKIDRVCKYTA